MNELGARAFKARVDAEERLARDLAVLRAKVGHSSDRDDVMEGVSALQLALDGFVLQRMFPEAVSQNADPDSEQRRPLVVNSMQDDLSKADVVNREVQLYREESEQIGRRLEALKRELYKRKNMLEEARKIELAEKARQDAMQKKMEEQRRQLASAKAAAAAASSSEGENLLETKHSSKEEIQTPEPITTTAKSLIEDALAARKRFVARKAEVEKFTKQFRKKVNGCKSMIANTAETVQAIRLGYDGNVKFSGAGAFLMQLQQARKPELMEVGMQVVAVTILRFATTNTAPDSIKAGETKFALVYLALALSINFPGFWDHLMEALYHECPFTCPGLREALYKENKNADREKLRHVLGYNPDESNADYIARMQTHVGFLAGLHQTNVQMLAKPPYNLVTPNVDIKHPCTEGGLVSGWRWASMTLNRPLSRWTAHVLVAYSAVAGYELSRNFPSQTRKLIALLNSQEFLSKIKVQAVLDTSKEDNDADRITIFSDFFARHASKGSFPPPGKPSDGQDIRQLVLDVAENRAE